MGHLTNRPRLACQTISRLYVVLSLLTLMGCAAATGSEPSETAQPAPGVTAPIDRVPAVTPPAVQLRLSNVLIGQIQRLNIGSLELRLDCLADGLCPQLPEARLACYRNNNQVLSTNSPEYCILVQP